MSLTVVILTFNEAQHIGRAIGSVRGIANRIFVIDSGSTDQTVALARANGAEVLENKWVNYATQFNWALDQLPADTDWILRLDADEIVTAPLAAEIAAELPKLGPQINGVYVSRRMTFLRRPIRHGGVFPVRIVRLFRHGRGRCENRWMDEHIKVAGPCASFKNEILDDNMNSLTWWTAKHNSYANREALDLLNLEFGFMPHDTVADIRAGQQAGTKRWLKEKVYARLPGGARSLAYFCYRYIIRMGFLDGREGALFHVLQGFWYRYLVDAKLYEVRKCMRTERVDVLTAIDRVLGIRLENPVDHQPTVGQRVLT